MHPRPDRTAGALLSLAALTLLAACGSDPQPAPVVVVPPAQAAPPTTVVQPAPVVLPPGARIVCADGRSPPC